MEIFLFVFNSILLGIGLAMDAFSVSVANGLNEPDMKPRKVCLVSGTFGFFQALMPMIGWVCIHTVVGKFKYFEKFVPWIALILLAFIGTKMIMEGINQTESDNEAGKKAGFITLIVQGIATSIDALSVGFTIADDTLPMALLSAVIIAAVTFFICLAGLVMGKKFSSKLSNKASVFGGVILVFIGLEIFITSFI